MKTFKFGAMAATVAFLALSAPALAEPGKADPKGDPDPPGHHYGFGTPLPLAGVGIVALLGGAVFLRRRMNKRAE